MKILKWVLIIVVVLIAIPLIGALFTTHDYSISRDVVINKPKQDVFNYIKLVRNQDNYSKWNMTDPNAKKDYKGTDGTVGFIYTWDSQNKHVGQGKQEITGITDGSEIDMDLHFIRPMHGNAKAVMTTEAVTPAQTKVKWNFSSHMPYPLNFMLAIMNMDKMMGPDLAEGLNNLKGVLEK
jgi:hypothetical protein